ncbi:MAG: aminopeptidase P family protein [Sedimentisphaerales bacterium]|nr:aminopeptidase P family protein [Sedimentisphaerales bacterium]
MNTETAKARIRKLRNLMRKNEIDALLVTHPQNVTYLTGFLGEDSWLLVGRQVCLVTDSRYTEQARGECVGCKIIERIDPLAQTVRQVLDKWKHRKTNTMGIESSCTFQTHKIIRKALKSKLLIVDNMVESLRQTKDDTETRILQKAARTAWRALAHTTAHILPGITESELTGVLEYQMRRLGMSPGFPTIICFGPNGSRNHHQPGSRKLRKKDTILIDFGVRYQGYISDTTRSFSYGKPSKEYEKAYYAVLKAQHAAIAEIRHGVELKQIDAVARETIATEGFEPYGHGTGHGLGLQVHEDPYLAKKAKGKLQAGQVVTVEPGIYIPGKFGIRIEDDVLVTKTGCKVLSEDKEFGFSRKTLPVLG